MCENETLEKIRISPRSESKEVVAKVPLRRLWEVQVKPEGGGAEADRETTAVNGLPHG